MVQNMPPKTSRAVAALLTEILETLQEIARIQAEMLQRIATLADIKEGV